MIPKKNIIIFMLFLLAITFVLAAENDSLGLSIVPENVSSLTESGNSIEIQPAPTFPINETDSGSPTGASVAILPADPLVNKSPVEKATNDSSIEVPQQPINQTAQLPIQQPSLIKTILVLIVNKITAFVGDVVNIEAMLRDENQTPIPDKKVDFYADELIGSDITDNEGRAKIEWNTSSWLPGAYKITANFTGDEVFEPVSRSIDIEVKESPLSTSAENNYNISPIISTEEKTRQEYQQIIDDAINKGDSYALIEYENNSTKYEVLTPNNQNFVLTRSRPKSTEIYDVDQLVLRSQWWAYKNISRDLSDQFGKMRHKAVLKPQANTYLASKNKISLLNNLNSEDRDGQDLGYFNEDITIQNDTYIYTITLNGDFLEHKLLLNVYLPNIGIKLEEMDCSFTEGGFTFDVCDNDMEFITRFDNELLFGFGEIGANKEVTIKITKK
ncbi:MAG: Ig-like domain-containing protein [Nanoarchaeota archaeon]|nr:Ig-like domain-containing protein [Nanoarchaeota archaeon]